jgi:methionine sulfoxide reductase catalytic subunit
MLIRTNSAGFIHPVSSEITPAQIYQSRRDLIRLMGSGIAGAALATWAGREALAQAPGWAPPGQLAGLARAKSTVSGAMVMEKVTEYKHASTYNNFYEFGTDKADPAQNAKTLKVSPWSVEIEGLVKKPGRYALEDLLKLSAQEERIYRLRCVEGWSMVIPWVGYSLSELVKKVEPLGNAKFVEFVTLADPKTMPGVGSRVLDWPYMVKCCQSKTVRRCAWWCHGSMASKVAKAWSKFALPTSSRPPPGTRPRPVSTVFSRM